MKKLRLLFSLGACFLAAWIPAYAHHSFQAEYDDEKPITLTGNVTRCRQTIRTGGFTST